MKCLNLGCGNNILPKPWINHDTAVDLKRKLPYPSNTIDRILLEHVLEHLDSRAAWSFLEEARRILKVNGVIRIICPSIFIVEKKFNESYASYLQRHGLDGSIYSAIKSIAYNYGHKTLWTPQLLGKVLEVIGFSWQETELYTSTYPEFIGAEGHWKCHKEGKEADITGFAVEGIKKER